MSNFPSSFPAAPPRPVPHHQAPAPRSATTPAPAPAPVPVPPTPVQPPYQSLYPTSQTFQSPVPAPAPVPRASVPPGQAPIPISVPRHTPPSASSSSSQTWGQTPSLPLRPPIVPPTQSYGPPSTDPSLIPTALSSFPPAPPRQAPTPSPVPAPLAQPPLPRSVPTPRSAPTPAPAPALLHNPFVSSGTPTLPPSFTPYPPLVASSAGSSQGATFQPSVLLPPPSASSSSSQPWGQTPSLPPRTPIAPPPSFTSYPSPSAPPAPQARLASSASDSNTIIRQIISQLPMMLELGLSATEDAIQPLEKYSVGILRENASVFRNLVSQVESKLEGSVLSPEDAKSAEVILLKLERILEKIEGPAGGTSNRSRSELDELSGKGFVAERASILAPVPSVFQNLYLYDSKQIFNTLYAEIKSIQLAHRQHFEALREVLVRRGSSDVLATKAIGIIDSIFNPAAGGGASVSLGIPAPVPAPGFNVTTPVAAPVAAEVLYVQAEPVILRGTELIAALGQLRLNSSRSIAAAEAFLRENSDAIRQDLDSSRPQLQRLYTEANSISDSDTKRSVKEVLCSLDGTLKGSNSFFRF